MHSGAKYGEQILGKKLSIENLISFIKPFTLDTYSNILKKAPNQIPLIYWKDN